MNDTMKYGNVPASEKGQQSMMNNSPEVHRILEVEVTSDGTWQQVNATICGRSGICQVTWWTSNDPGVLQSGQLVQCEWSNHLEFHNGFLMVQGLSMVATADPEVNLIDTVPASWLPPAKEQSACVVQSFRRLWGQLSRPMRAWFNALFWHQPERWERFLKAPASIGFHHARKHGLFTHSVDCGMRSLRAAQGDELVNVDVLLMAALLHDLGKADEYVLSKYFNACKLSERGALMGHRLSTLEWMAAALGLVQSQDAPDEAKVMAVYHAINACHAQDWVGLRPPRTPEAFYLASADALSGNCDLIKALAKPGSRQGKPHKAFRGAAWVTGKAE